jgi:hypothetical protein
MNDREAQFVLAVFLGLSALVASCAFLALVLGVHL